MDPFYSGSISGRTRSGWVEQHRAMAREWRDEARRNVNGASSGGNDWCRVTDDDGSEEDEDEEEETDESCREFCSKRRRFDDPGSSSNPYLVDDDDDDDDEPVRSSGKRTRSSNGLRSVNGGKNGSVGKKLKREKKKKEKEKEKEKEKPSFSGSASSSSLGFRRIDSDVEELDEASSKTQKKKKTTKTKKNKKEKEKQKEKKIREPSSSSDHYPPHDSPFRESTKKKKNKRKQLSSSDSDSDSESLEVKKKKDPKSEEPRNEVGRRRSQRLQSTKKASSDDDHDHDHDDDDDGEQTESESEPVEAKTQKAARVTRPVEGPKPKVKVKVKAKAKKKVTGREFFKVLVNSMTDTGKDYVENLVASEKKPEERNGDGDVSSMPLSYKFSFPEKLALPEKSEYEKAMDSLWTELRLSLASLEIGSAASSRAEGDEDYDEEDGDGLDLDALCEQGRHQERLDDQHGLHCSNCFKTITRIQDILPCFGKNSSGQSRYQDPGSKRSSFFDEFGSNELNDNHLTDAELLAKAKTVWDMIPGVKRKLYPHQQEGFEFLWKHIAGGIEREYFERVKSATAGRGCIISHAPGTGKTLLTIVFLQALMKLHPECLPVIIAPCSMLLTWGEEFRKWRFDAPFHNLNSPTLSGREYEAATALFKTKGGRSSDMRDIRALKLYSWTKGGSVLGVSYTTFEKLASPKADPTDQQVREILLNSPGLLVLDEGHIPRNECSLIYQVLERVKTRKRIMLSGTPFQNNFEELYNTMEMVNPGFSKTQMAGYNKSDNRASLKKAARKDWKQLTKSFGEDATQLNQIKAMIDPFVHIHRGEVLEKSLPGVKETIVVLNPTKLQKTILGEIQISGKDQLQRQFMVSLISIHPSLATVIENESFSVTNSELNAKRLNPDYGVKMKFLMGLIRLSDAAKERVLVFSQYLDPLRLVKEHLSSEFGWNESNEILYIDGKQEMKERQSAINKFNNLESSAKVCLVSTKAGGEGINLVGASRVVLLDVVWNPSVERQATRRAYRLGQKKFVFVYHLVALGTMEEAKFSRQVTKEKWSKMVFSSPTSGGSLEPRAPQRVREDKVLNAMLQHENLKGIFEMIEIKNHSGFLDPQAPASSNSDF